MEGRCEKNGRTMVGESGLFLGTLPRNIVREGLEELKSGFLDHSKPFRTISVILYPPR